MKAIDTTAASLLQIKTTIKKIIKELTETMITTVAAINSIKQIIAASTAKQMTVTICTLKNKIAAAV